jgi:hypothetical protein
MNFAEELRAGFKDQFGPGAIEIRGSGAPTMSLPRSWDLRVVSSKLPLPLWAAQDRMGIGRLNLQRSTKPISERPSASS